MPAREGVCGSPGVSGLLDRGGVLALLMVLQARSAPLLSLSGLRGVVGEVVEVDLAGEAGSVGSWHPGWGLCGSQAPGIAGGVLERCGMSLSGCGMAGVETGLVLGPVRWWGVVGPGPCGVGGDVVADRRGGSSGASCRAGSI